MAVDGGSYTFFQLEYLLSQNVYTTEGKIRPEYSYFLWDYWSPVP
jgi:hypothetical protein